MPLNITILGLDTIGGSLGMALGTLEQDALPSGRPIITGWDANKRTLQDARGRLVIDRAARDASEAVADADVVFVAVPQTELPDLFRTIAPHLKHGALVSDTGSTKAPVLELARTLLPSTIDFIGGHPLLAQQAAPQTASIDLFRGTIYCVVLGLQTRPTAPDQLAQLITAIGAKPYYIDAAEHDAYVAAIYHLPLLLGSALIETVSRSPGWRDIQPLAGAPFRSATQLAATDPALLTALARGNQTEVEHWINQLIRTLVELRDQLPHAEHLEATLEHAHEAYEQWQAAQPNMRPGENDYYGQTDDIPQRSLSSLFLGQRRKKGR